MQVVVISKIQELEEVSAFSKHEQIVQGVINAINENDLEQGEMLPSVNNMVKELGFASKTIVKAYNDLKDRGVIDSKKRLGYYVLNEDTSQTMKVALLIYAFHSFQEMFYNAFRASLGDKIQVDVFFHHNNINVFKTILKNISGKYARYVIAPIPNPKTKKLLNRIPRERLLLVDRYENLEGSFSNVTQEFEASTFNALMELKESIEKYKNIILYYLPNSDYPMEIKNAFNRFLSVNALRGETRPKYNPGTVQAGEVHFTIGDSDLWQILKDCKKKGLKVGKDIGILSNNDSIVKEIIVDGITTLSTNFEEMGRQAALHILKKGTTNHTIPTVLVRRNSL